MNYHIISERTPLPGEHVIVLKNGTEESLIFGVLDNKWVWYVNYNVDGVESYKYCYVHISDEWRYDNDPKN